MNTRVKTQRRTFSQTCRDIRDYAAYHVECQNYAAEHYGETLTVWGRLSCWLDGAATGFFNDNRWMPIAQRLTGRTAEWDAFWASPPSTASGPELNNQDWDAGDIERTRLSS